MQGNHSVWKRKDAGASGPGILVDPLTALHNLPAWAAVDRTAPVSRRRPKTPPSLHALSCQRPSPWQEMSATDDSALGAPKGARQNPSYTRRPKTPPSVAALSCQAPRRQPQKPARRCNSWQEMSATDDWASGPPQGARQNPSYTRRPKTPSSVAAISCQPHRR